MGNARLQPKSKCNLHSVNAKLSTLWLPCGKAALHLLNSTLRRQLEHFVVILVPKQHINFVVKSSGNLPHDKCYFLAGEGEGGKTIQLLQR